MFGAIRSHTYGRVAFALIIPLMFLVLGSGAGLGIANLLAYLETKSVWVELPQAPSEPVEMIGANSGCVFVNSVDGNVYMYCERYSTNQDPWERLDEPARILDSECPDDAFPDPPRGTIQAVEHCFGHEVLDYSQFALLEDGMIKMYWIQTDSAMGQLGRGFSAIFFGSIIGLVLGIGAVVVVLTGEK
jgi:hypothetical protein